jgi:hypothetical protein
MRAAQTPRMRIETHGGVPAGSAELAEAKVGPLLRAAVEPVLSARGHPGSIYGRLGRQICSGP